MSERTNSNPNKPRLTTRGKTVVAAGIGAAGMAALFIGQGSEKPAQAEPTIVCYDTQNTKDVVVQDGDGINNIIAREYGVEDGVVQNNVCYEAEVAAVEAQMTDDLLHEGQVLHIPVDIIPQEK